MHIKTRIFKMVVFRILGWCQGHMIHELTFRVGLGSGFLFVELALGRHGLRSVARKWFYANR